MNLEALRSFPARLAQTVSAVRDVDRAEAEGKWSVADVVAHLADLELVYAVRIRSIVAGAGETPLQALPQNAWIERVHRREPLAELVEQFAFLRAMNVAFLARLSEEELSRSGIHPEYGAITAHHAAERLERHDAKHHAQIERIAATL
ncbi:MAG TPA: DinB family protein [Thermoanaerobaculia bacterium]|jgi:hypothetical protein